RVSGRLLEAETCGRRGGGVRRAARARISQGEAVTERGAATVYFLVFSLVLFGFLMMATDFGRIYAIQGELQTAADAAALAAATQLVGTTAATMHAGDRVTASFDSTTGNDNRFNLRMNQLGESGGSGLVTTMSVDYFPTLVDAQANSNGAQTGGIEWS